MRLTFSRNVDASSLLVASASGKAYSLSAGSIRVFGTEEEHRVHSGGAGGAIRGNRPGRLTGAVYINDGRFVNALWLFVGAE